MKFNEKVNGKMNHVYWLDSFREVKAKNLLHIERKCDIKRGIRLYTTIFVFSVGGFRSFIVKTELERG